MTLSYVRFGGPLLVLALVACGIQEAAWGGDLAHRVAARQEVGACKVLDLQAAIQVIGRGTEQLGDTEQALCMYSNPGVAQLTIQLYPAESYDQITILKPHTPVQIGDKARYNVEKTGVVALSRGFPGWP